MDHIKETKPKNSKEYRKWKLTHQHNERADWEAGLRQLGEEHGYKSLAFDKDKLESCLVDKRYVTKVELNDGTILDPAILIVSSLDTGRSAKTTYLHSSPFYVGGQVKTIEPSKLLLPPEIIEVCQNEPREYRMNAVTPLLLSINGEQKYIAQAFTIYVKWGDKTGSMVDTDNWRVIDAHSEKPRPDMLFDDTPAASYVFLIPPLVEDNSKIHMEIAALFYSEKQATDADFQNVAKLLKDNDFREHEVTKMLFEVIIPASAHHIAKLILSYVQSEEDFKAQTLTSNIINIEMRETMTPWDVKRKITELANIEFERIGASRLLDLI